MHFKISLFTILVIGLVIILIIIRSKGKYQSQSPNTNPSTNIINKDCSIKISNSLKHPQPLILKQKPSSYLETFIWPSKPSGDIILKENEVAFLACPGGYLIIEGKNTVQESAEVKCSNNTFAILTYASVAFNTIKCSKIPDSIARYIRTCLDKHMEIEVGFEIKNYGFLRQLVICFDRDLKSTLYSMSELSRHIDEFQYSFEEYDKFKPDVFFNGFNLDNSYNWTTQIRTINTLLGLPENSSKYINDVDNLSRNHLASRADYLFVSQQISTFYYVNVAPQWSRFNTGNWKILEDSTRSYATKKGLDLTVYTGTHGIATLPHQNFKNLTELYLHADRFNTIIPVPEVFWKIVYEKSSQKGVAFVGVNNPFVQNYTPLCTDICKKITWINFRSANADLGYSYCCEVNDLRKTIENIPNNITVISLLT